MPRRTKEELRKARNEKRISDLIERVKFLRDPKYYKNNYWSWAHYQSWAVNGKAGSCGCGCGYYSASLNNKRHTTERGGRESFCKQVIEKLCSDCVKMIEVKIGVEFKRDYAP